MSLDRIVTNSYRISAATDKKGYTYQMRDYVIITDSTADLPDEVFRNLGIEVIPMEFIMDEKIYSHYSDAREMDFLEFYDNIKQGKKASTTQINYFTYEKVFRPVLDSGKDILYIAFSSGLSGTYQASTLIVEDLKQEYKDSKIISIDSLCASIGEGLLVYLAGLKKKEGLSLKELQQWVLDNRLKACHMFVVDDLHHLKEGGRITAVQATLGTALNLKPMLSVDKNGKLVPVSKIRGTKRILEAFIDRFLKDRDGDELQSVVIGHANNMETANLIREALLERKLVKETIITDVGPIIGAHVGAGMAALAFMGQRNL